MVLVVIKHSEQDQFMVETTAATSNDELIRTAVKIHNMRLKTAMLADAIKALAEHGPARSEAERGLDEVGGSGEGGGADRGANYSADPTGNRTGQAPNEALQRVLNKVADDAKKALDGSLVRAKVTTTVAGLQEKLDCIRGAVTMAYPMGLPKHDLIRAAIEDVDHKESYGKGTLEPDTATLWWAGKEFFRDQKVGDRTGRNEKTKVIAKLKNPGSGPPQREPIVGEAERKAMMAHYFKRNEEMKRLAEDDDDGYTNASWANPNALKQSLTGTGGGLRFR